MGRPPLPVGTFGRIRFEQLGRNRVQAGASFRDFDGHRRYVVRNGPTRAQAERRLREALRDRGRTETPPVPTDSRLHALAARWLADIDDSELAAGTKRLYRFTVHAYVLPELGELRLREITVPAIDRLLASVHTDHGPGAAKSTRSVLSGILGLAIRHGLGFCVSDLDRSLAFYSAIVGIDARFINTMTSARSPAASERPAERPCTSGSSRPTT